MNEGWIKLHRQLLKWEWYNKPNTLRVFIHCLLKANHQKRTWRGIEIPQGAFISSPEKIGKELDLSRQNVRSAIINLQSTNNLTTKTTNKYTLISINNYESYQQSNQQIIENQPANHHQLTTNKNDKEEKKEELVYIRLTKFQKQKIAGDFMVTIPFVESVIDDLQSYCRSKGISYANYVETVRIWTKKEAMKLKKEEHGKSKISVITPDPAWEHTS